MTISEEFKEDCLSISIHTPALGVTICHNTIKHLIMHFNPHSRTGSDEIKGKGVTVSDISIHTPALGVTEAEYIDPCLYGISIHTPALGVTSSFFLLQYAVIRFQSTLPHWE